MIQWLSTSAKLITDIVASLEWRDILDLALLTVLIYNMLALTMGTRASAVLKGVGVLLLLNWVIQQLGLLALGEFSKYIINVGFILLVVLFQPELRRALEQLGRGTFIERLVRGDTEGNMPHIVSELTSCLLRLSKRKVGLLAVIEMNVGLSDVAQSGEAIDGKISARLLENIFEPNTPLHDGAVVLRGDRVVAAACILKLTENPNLSSELGTRHRAAIGVTEESDALALIVSEETGVISAARNGRLTRHLDEAKLRQLLEPIYSAEPGRFPQILHRRKKGNA